MAIKRILFLLFILISIPVFSQNEKVGLCLSGGGARGLAHIGVIKLLEEVGLTPDYVTGVSSGSLVGGLYSMGYSADSMTSIVKTLDWETLFSDKITERGVRLEEKKDFRNKLFNISYKNRSFTPTDGLTKGQQFLTVLDYYTWPAHDIYDFNNLPIPFKAVAADISACKKVVLDKGSLAAAMRSSMSVPSAFSPFLLDSLLLVDGGLVRNFPVPEIREMGADIVIGVYTGRRLYKKSELKSVTSILGQVASFPGLFDAEEQLNDVEILIKPDVEQFKVFNFSAVDSIIEQGYLAALPMKKELEELAKKRAKTDANRNIHHLLDNACPFVINKIKIEGNTVITDEQFLKKINIKLGEEVDQFQLKKKMDKLYGTLLFDQVDYSLERNGIENTLTIKCLEKPKNLINFALNYNNAFGPGISLSFIKRNLLLHNSKFTTRAQIAKYYRLKLNYLYYLTKNQNTFFNLETSLYKDNLPAYILETNYQAFNQLNWKSNLSINKKIGFNRNLKVGLEYEKISTSPVIKASSNLIRSTITNISPFISYEVNTLDDYYLPTSGWHTFIEGKSVELKNAVLHYSDTSSNLGNAVNVNNSAFYIIMRNKTYFPMGKKFSSSLRLNAVATITDDTLVSSNNFGLIGGSEIMNPRSLPFYGFKINELVAQDAIGVGFGLHLNPSKKTQFSFYSDAYVLHGLTKKFLATNILYGAALEATYRSRIGPVKFAVANGFYDFNKNFNNLKFYLNIGYQF